jgi:hypothetical protein
MQQLDLFASQSSPLALRDRRPTKHPNRRILVATLSAYQCATSEHVRSESSVRAVSSKRFEITPSKNQISTTAIWRASSNALMLFA